MNDRLSRVQASRSAAIKARLQHPVIDTDVHVNDYAPVLEEMILPGSATILDAIRKTAAY